MRHYRGRARQEVVRLRQALKDLTVENRFTRTAFERKIGKRRHVLVVEREHGQAMPLYSGMVVGFLPGERLSVLIETGEVISVGLAEIERDYACDDIPEDSEPGMDPKEPRLHKIPESARIKRRRYSIPSQ